MCVCVRTYVCQCVYVYMGEGACVCVLPYLQVRTCMYQRREGEGGATLSANARCCLSVLTSVALYLIHCLWLQVVQEYERAVIFRLGRLLSGGAKGPGTSIPPLVSSPFL